MQSPVYLKEQQVIGRERERKRKKENRNKHRMEQKGYKEKDENRKGSER